MALKDIGVLEAASLALVTVTVAVIAATTVIDTVLPISRKGKRQESKRFKLDTFKVKLAGSTTWVYNRKGVSEVL